MLLHWENSMAHSNVVVGLGSLLLIAACSSSGGNSDTGDTAGGSGATNMAGAAGVSSAGSPAAGSGGSAGSAGAGTTQGGGAGSGGSGGGAVGTCTPPTDVFSPITTLSQTGCVDPTDPRKPIARAVAYEVNSPLWSDSADKQRAFVLPAGGKIHVRDCTASPSDCAAGGTADDGRWDFPVGTVMIKIFMFDDKLVETRLFMHIDADNWYGYSYQWDEAQTDAKIVSPDRATVMFNTQQRTVPWHYPSQEDCLTCHNQAGGSTIGPETAQMNRVVGTKNQIDTFAALGLFETPPAMPYKAALVAPYTSQAGTAPANPTAAELTMEARSYLHANCGFCHRPGGAFANFDLRYDTKLTPMNVCGQTISKAPLTSALDKNLILSPGHSMDSVMWLRMNLADPDAGRMPQIASYAVDTNAVSVVGKWIDSLKADCTN
jgi:uncharacterized repeat protein (TIGR03806 family)